MFPSHVFPRSVYVRVRQGTAVAVFTYKRYTVEMECDVQRVDLLNDTNGTRAEFIRKLIHNIFHRIMSECAVDAGVLLC